MIYGNAHNNAMDTERRTTRLEMESLHAAARSTRTFACIPSNIPDLASFVWLNNQRHDVATLVDATWVATDR
jgi:hypothetical protein